MHYKNLEVVFLLLFLPGVALAQDSFSDSYKPGDKLYVYSQDGLSLREKADPKGKLILVAAWGDALVVLEDPQPRVSFIRSNIPGAWVKVKHRDKTGYIFNGFLSRFKPMANSTKERYRDDFYNYLKQEFKPTKETKKPPEPIYIDYLKMELANGATYEAKDYEGGTMIIVQFPIKVITYQEVFLMARLAYPEFFVDKKCDYKVNDTQCDDGVSTSLAIKKDGRAFSITYGFAD